MQKEFEVRSTPRLLSSGKMAVDKTRSSLERTLEAVKRQLELSFMRDFYLQTADAAGRGTVRIVSVSDLVLFGCFGCSAA